MTDSRISRHFDTLAAGYDRYKHPLNFYFATLKHIIQNEITHADRARILDIGCGTGTILAAVNRRYVLGIDISSKMISQARKKYAHYSWLQFEMSDIEHKPVKKKFDYILCTDVIEHFTNQEIAIKNISASMSKKTTFILSMANPAWEPFLQFLEKVHLKMPEGPHLRISEQALFSLLTKYQLSVLRKNTYLPRIKRFEKCGLLSVYIITKF